MRALGHRWHHHNDPTPRRLIRGNRSASRLPRSYDFVGGERYTIITDPYRMWTTAFMSFSPVHRFRGRARLRSQPAPRRAFRPVRT
jgi:hypothetical protein